MQVRSLAKWSVLLIVGLGATPLLALRVFESGVDLNRISAAQMELIERMEKSFAEAPAPMASTRFEEMVETGAEADWLARQDDGAVDQVELGLRVARCLGEAHPSSAQILDFAMSGNSSAARTW
jgi:hypothetical protein